jgi:membrane protease YdiL (CAAX protease family)
LPGDDEGSDDEPSLSAGTPGVEQPPSGRPGSTTFSLEGRPAPGLYLVAWLLSGFGLALLFLAGLADVPARGVLLMGGLIMITAGLSAAAGYQVVARRDRHPAAYRGPSPLIVFGAFFVFINAFISALVVLGLDIQSPIGLALVLFVQVGGYFVVVWLFAVRTGALSWSGLDLGRPLTLRRLGSDALVGIGLMIPATFIILIVTAAIFTVLGVRPPQVVPTPTDPLQLMLIGVAVVLLVPIGEELFFRGFALTAWLRDLGERAAVTRSALFFALFHIINIQAGSFDEGARQALGVVLVILPVGVVLGLLFTRRGLVAAMGAHAIYNGIGYAGRLLAENMQLSPPPA